MIPCANPLAQYASHRQTIDAAVARVMASGWYILGEETRQFEAEFATFCESRHGIGVGSGTEALQVALAALGIGRGDEVVTVSHTAVATIAAIEAVGAIPVLADIDPDYFTLDPAKLEQALSPRTKAIIPVHLYGQPADMEPILNLATRSNAAVIEDCAQAHGARYRGSRVGAMGAAACFSFYPTKNLGAMGDGGMVVTGTEATAERARLIREYGWAERYVSSIPGWNSRLDEIQAAILRVKLQTLEEDNIRRQELARRYDARLQDTPLTLPACRAGCEHVYHLYVVRAAQRDALQAHLKNRDIGALIHYPVPIHRQPAYAGRLEGYRNLEETEKAARDVLSLPMYPELGFDEQDRVIEAILDFYRK